MFIVYCEFVSGGEYFYYIKFHEWRYMLTLICDSIRGDDYLYVTEISEEKGIYILLRFHKERGVFINLSHM